MKKNIHILLTIFLSALIFYGGSGVNVFFFCCSDCQAEKANVITLITGKKCCCASQRADNKDVCCHHHSEKAYCGVDRIEFDWQSASGNQIPLQPISIDLDNSIFLSVQTANAMLVSCLLNKQSQNPPHLSKDDYFDLLCMLII